MIDASGKVVGRYEWKKGKAYWLDADKPGELHGDRNDADKTIEVIIVEMQHTGSPSNPRSRLESGP